MIEVITKEDVFLPPDLSVHFCSKVGTSHMQAPLEKLHLRSCTGYSDFFLAKVNLSSVEGRWQN